METLKLDKEKKVGFRVLIYKEAKMKRKPYTVQEKLELLKSTAIEKVVRNSRLVGNELYP